MSSIISTAFLVVSAVIFGLIAFIHLIRGLNGWSFVVGPLTIPVWESWIAFVGAVAMCSWAVRLVAAQPRS